MQDYLIFLEKPVSQHTTSGKSLPFSLA